MTGEEGDLEGQAEDPLDAQVAGVLQQRLEDLPADAAADGVLVDRERAHLGEVLPEDVQRTAAQHLTVDLGDPELLQSLVVRDGVLGHEHTRGRQRLHQVPDRADVTGAGAAYLDHGTEGSAGAGGEAQERLPSRRSAK